MKRVLFLIFWASMMCWAQSYTASVRGTVTDSTQAPLPSASITLTEVDRNIQQTTTTDSSGRYVIPSVPSGRYTLTIAAAGFKKAEQPQFTLEVQQQATFNVQLSVGDVTTSVEVQGAAPLVNTTSATLGQVVENRFISSMPNASRQPLSLVAMAPGVVGATGGVNFVSNGVRNSSAEALLDGTVITSMEQNGGITTVKYQPSVDVVEEFKLQTNYFSAEFGNTGGSVINVISKSGTNKIHGVGYEFLRENPLNANSWFGNKNGSPLADSKRNIFGGTIGGPVFIPKLYNGRNRTFIFADAELQRSSNATTATNTVPTAQQLVGDFSDTRLANGNLSVIYNPYDTFTNSNGAIMRNPFAGNLIPKGLQNPLALNVEKYFPAPTSAGNAFTRVNNWFAQGTNKSAVNQMDYKIDHNISEKQRLTSRYSVSWSDSTPANLFGNIAYSANNGHSRNQNFLIDYTRTHNPTTVINVRAAVLRVAQESTPLSLGFDQTSLGLSHAFLEATGTKWFPQFAVTGYQSLGYGSYSETLQYEDAYTLSGSVTKIYGGHTLKMGGEYRRLHENYMNPNLPAGGFTFNRGVTSQNPLVSSSSQGDGLASYLLGWGASGTLSYDYLTATTSAYAGGYIQDDWRISRKLTLNLGLRYDVDIPRTERFNRLDWFDPNAASPLAGKVPRFPNLKGVIVPVDDSHRSPFNYDANNVQPRIGLAYALNGKTSIRSAYGIFYTVNRNQVKGEVGHDWRNDTSMLFSRDGGYTQYATLQNPFPDGLTPPPGPTPLAYLGFGVSSIDPNSQNQQYQQWNFSIQRQIPAQGVVEVNYSASKGTHLFFYSGNINRLDPSYFSLGRTALNALVPNPFYGVIKDPTSLESLPTVALVTLLRPLPQYNGGVGGYLAPPNIGNSHYHSVQFKYEKRFSKGMSVVAHYTISKLISDGDTQSGDVSFLGSGGGVQDWKNLRNEKALSGFDVPQRLVASFDYLLPLGRQRAFGKHMNRVVDGIVGGWEMSGILTLSSAMPLVPTLSSPTLWEGTQRPNLIGDPSQPGSIEDRLNKYFNTAAFSQPAADTFGNAPRTLSNYRGPGLENIDMTLMKNFTMGEQRRLQLRLEAYNATNTPHFGNPNIQVGGTSFGIISSASGARVVQVAAKFYF